MNLVLVLLVMDYLEIVLLLLAIVKMDTLKLQLMKTLIVNSAVLNVLIAHPNQNAIYALLTPTEIPIMIVIV
jgi:hypothetical protein